MARYWKGGNSFHATYVRDLERVTGAPGAIVRVGDSRERGIMKDAASRAVWEVVESRGKS